MIAGVARSAGARDRAGIANGTDAAVEVTGATSATILVAAATGYRGWQVRPAGPGEEMRARIAGVLDGAAARSARELHVEHVAEHRALFDRVTLRLGAAPESWPAEVAEHEHEPSSADPRPTDERLAAISAGEDDPALAALYFAYGRYLLIASSRPGTQAANLQGIWNPSVLPPWNSNWTTNINTQMNYWGAESTALPECHEPLFDLIDGLAEAGQRTARAYYGCGGWTLPTTTPTSGAAPTRSGATRSGPTGRWGQPGCVPTCGSTTVHR